MALVSGHVDSEFESQRQACGDTSEDIYVFSIEKRVD